MPLRLLETGFISPLQTHQSTQSRAVTALQPQPGIRREMPGSFPWVVIVIALELEGTKQALHRQLDPAFAMLARLGLVARVDLVGRVLEQPADQLRRRLEQSRAQQSFQLLHAGSRGRLRREAPDQLLDLGFLGERNLGSESDRLFFFESAAINARVWATF